MAALLLYFVVTTVMTLVCGRHSAFARYSFQGLAWRLLQHIDPQPSDGLYESPLAAAEPPTDA